MLGFYNMEITLEAVILDQDKPRTLVILFDGKEIARKTSQE